MSKLFDKISKKVGWGKKNIPYPTMTEVKQALKRHNEDDIYNLIKWHRFLKSPEGSRQTNIINLIDNGLMNMKV